MGRPAQKSAKQGQNTRNTLWNRVIRCQGRRRKGRLSTAGRHRPHDATQGPRTPREGTLSQQRPHDAYMVSLRQLPDKGQKNNGKPS
jgi:hypothetical protein